MKLCLDLFDYSCVKRVEDSTGRKYINNLGQKIPSVTTILDHTQDKTHLIAWRKRVGDQVANQISQESTSLGTLMHTHLENHLLGKHRPSGTNFGRKMAEKMADQIINNGLINVDQVWGIEVPLSYENLWAGTADLIGVHKGEPAIMDFKTTKKPKIRSRIDDYRLQLTAYRMCHDLSFNTNIRKLVIFMCSRDLQYQEFVYEFDNFSQDTTDWLWRVHDYYSRVNP